jgi:CheY-like chemotaxis protein
MALVAVLDDEQNTLELLSELMMDGGYEVVGHQIKSDFLELMPILEPDVIITDVVAPRMDGIQFIKALKEDPRYRDIPVIIVSGFLGERPEEIKKAFQLGAYDCFPKPFDPEHLMSRVKEAIGQH